MAQQQSKRKRSVKRMGVEDEQQSKRNSLSIILPSRILLPEIIVKILLRFPVETLLRCKSVCKSWYTLISCRYVHPRLIFSIISIPVVSFNLPFKLSPPSVWLIGSCNGLFCIVVDYITPVLYNPSTRIYKRLYGGFSVGVCFTFGYDESSDDYKVVGFSLGNKAKIYSLKLDRWKDIDDVPHISSWCHSGTFSNGDFHWMVRNMPVSYYWLTNIVSFDLATETYSEVSPPPLDGDECDRDIALRTLGEWLCVIVHYKGIRADLWVMKVYGVKDSWTKLVSIPYYTKVGVYVHVSMSNDGRFLLTFLNKLVVYDSMNCSFTEIHEFDGGFEACTHVDSLVSPHSPLIRNKLRSCRLSSRERMGASQVQGKTTYNLKGFLRLVCLFHPSLDAEQIEEFS